MPKSYDLAIRCSDNKSIIPRLIKAGGVEVFGYPEHLRRGGWVALVTKGNRIPLMFKVRDIEGPYKRKSANGKMRQRYFLRADKRSMQQPELLTLQSVRGWFSIGALRYFRKATMEAVVVGTPPFSSGKYIKNDTTKVSGTVFKIHTDGIPGKPHGHPESTLVNQYVKWLGDKVRFGHNRIREANLSVDLFDLTHWQLIEAKIATNRETIRMAIGQLRDYKRFYHRSPTLAVLLGSRPTPDCKKLLIDNRISVIWKNPSGSFSTKRWQS